MFQFHDSWNLRPGPPVSNVHPLVVKVLLAQCDAFSFFLADVFRTIKSLFMFFLLLLLNVDFNSVDFTY